MESASCTVSSFLAYAQALDTSLRERSKPTKAAPDVRVGMYHPLI